MVEFLGKWLMGVTCAAMILALAEGLSPAGGPKRAARLAGGLLLLLAVVKPLISLDGSALTRAMTEYRLDAEYSAQALEEENKTLMMDIIEAQSAAYIQDKAAALGITCTVQVEADEAAEYPIPKVVTITGELSREEREALCVFFNMFLLLYHIYYITSRQTGSITKAGERNEPASTGKGQRAGPVQGAAHGAVPAV